jgi:hypothetical protein
VDFGTGTSGADDDVIVRIVIIPDPFHEQNRTLGESHEAALPDAITMMVGDW